MAREEICCGRKSKVCGFHRFWSKPEIASRKARFWLASAEGKDTQARSLPPPPSRPLRRGRHQLSRRPGSCGRDGACGALVSADRGWRGGAASRSTGVRLSKLAPGQSASVEISGGGEISGHVRSVSSAVDQRTQMGSARIFLGEQGLPIGAFAKAVVVVGESCGSSVPLSAVIYDTDGAIVQVVRDNRIETRRVQVGLVQRSRISTLPLDK